MTTDDDGSATPTDPWAAEPTDGLSTDTAFELLAHHRRRRLLRCLREYDTPITLADLADEVAIREHDASLADIPAETVKRVYLSLYHRHVPKLEDAGIVTYSQQRDAVAVTDRAAELLPYLDVADG